MQAAILLQDGANAVEKTRLPKQIKTITKWEFASKPSAQKYFLSTVKSAIIQKYLIMEPQEK